ncbi:MAG: hypothetical protein LBR95_01750 [Azoarcus sp.]|nr:hypothetical protein [Azoarcus sp.]
MPIRQARPVWGGRKIAQVRDRDRLLRIAPCPVTHILHRHGLIDPAASEAATLWKRFEHRDQAQDELDRGRLIHNRERPHEALSMQPRVPRYSPRPRSLSRVLPPLEYGPDDRVRKVPHGGWISFRGRNIHLSSQRKGYPAYGRRNLVTKRFNLHQSRENFRRTWWGGIKEAAAFRRDRQEGLTHQAASVFHHPGMTKP